MSRTMKDKPTRVLEIQEPWRFECGWPPRVTGAWHGAHRYTKPKKHSQRQMVKMALRRLEEPHPWRKWPNDVKWEIW